MGDVKSIFGGYTGAPEPNQTCIETLEEWLEMARTGEIIGVAMSGLCCDGAGRYSVAGKVGGYSMLGGLEMAKVDLIRVNEEC